MNTSCNQYLSTINDNNFFQCIEKVTRIQNHSMSLIDHILTNFVTQEVNSGVITTDISENFPAFIELPSIHSKCKTKTNPSQNFSRVNLERFRDSLSHLDWANVINQMDVDLAYGNFWDIFKTLFDLNFPTSRTT